MDIISPTKFSTGDIKYSPNLALVTLNTPQTSEPYNNIGLIVWSKTLMHVFLPIWYLYYSYKYLDIHFTASGTFTIAINT
jgi:hypothetical protein